MKDETAERIAAALERIAAHLDELATTSAVTGEAIATALEDLQKETT